MALTGGIADSLKLSALKMVVGKDPAKLRDAMMLISSPGGYLKFKAKQKTKEIAKKGLKKGAHLAAKGAVKTGKVAAKGAVVAGGLAAKGGKKLTDFAIEELKGLGSAGLSILQGARNFISGERVEERTETIEETNGIKEGKNNSGQEKNGKQMDERLQKGAEIYVTKARQDIIDTMRTESRLLDEQGITGDEKYQRLQEIWDNKMAEAEKNKTLQMALDITNERLVTPEVLKVMPLPNDIFEKAKAFDLENSEPETIERAGQDKDTREEKSFGSVKEAAQYVTEVRDRVTDRMRDASKAFDLLGITGEEKKERMGQVFKSEIEKVQGDEKLKEAMSILRENIPMVDFAKMGQASALYGAIRNHDIDIVPVKASEIKERMEERIQSIQDYFKEKTERAKEYGMGEEEIGTIQEFMQRDNERVLMLDEQFKADYDQLGKEDALGLSFAEMMDQPSIVGSDNERTPHTIQEARDYVFSRMDSLEGVQDQKLALEDFEKDGNFREALSILEREPAAFNLYSDMRASILGTDRDNAYRDDRQEGVEKMSVMDKNEKMALAAETAVNKALADKIAEYNGTEKADAGTPSDKEATRDEGRSETGKKETEKKTTKEKDTSEKEPEESKTSLNKHVVSQDSSDRSAMMKVAGAVGVGALAVGGVALSSIGKAGDKSAAALEDAAQQGVKAGQDFVKKGYPPEMR